MTKFLLTTFFCAILIVFYTHLPETANGSTTIKSNSYYPNPPIPTITLSSKKAFPTAEGYGKYATGGRGGRIVAVTNLNSSGSGSLDAALKMTGPRIIVFKVSGTITHSGGNYLDIPYSAGNVTVAGETAPGDGILIKGGEIRISASNVIIRGLRIRQSSSSTGSNEDCINISAYNGTHIEDIIIDHCSLSWARDENLSLVGNFSGSTIKDVTVQNCIIAESNYGLLSYKKNENISVFRNLFIHNRERNIRSNHPQSSKLQYEMVNNLVHGALWRTNTSLGTKFTVLNNKYKASSQVSSKGSTSVNGESDGTGSTSNTHAYIKGNIQISGQGQYSSNLSPYIKSSPYKTSGLVGSAIPASEIESSLLPHVGASFSNHDAVDSRLINQYKNGNGGSASSGSFPSIKSGSAPTDSNNNHIPDSFESSHSITSSSQVKESYNFGSYQVINNAGYSALEIYLAYSAGDFDRMEKVGGTEETGKNCTETITPEYSLDGAWNHGSTNLNVEEGTDVTLSMYPNGVGVTIKLPNGATVGDNYDLGKVTTADSGAYLLTSEDGCQTTLNLSVGSSGNDANDNGCAAGTIVPEYRLDGTWNSGQNSLNVDEGTDVLLSMMPNGVDLSIKLPNGSIVGDNYSLGKVTSEDSGTYVITSEDGCQTTLNLSVGDSDNNSSDGSNNTNCSTGYVIPEYRLNGVWASGTSNLNVGEGTDVVLSMLPNGADLSIKLPNGSTVGDNFHLGRVTSADSGTYIITSEEGCQTILNLTVGDEVINTCPAGNIIPEYRYDGLWRSGDSNISVSEGEDLTLSMLPNGVGLTIKLPNGSIVGDNHTLTNISAANSGTYLLTSEDGCQTVINLSVEPKGTSLKVRFNPEEANAAAQDYLTLQNAVDELTVYPNPVQREINVSIPNHSNYTTYRLFNTSGILIKEGTIETGESNFAINVSKAQKGLILLNVSNDNGDSEFLKVLKK
ncbi:T9SS type A sorting domain-containing protein [uncultured Kriegella sp.]|uniref:T9SS type A sorting domain-containing protein n=1 Tax=uncultured Kriegella sp. TaxID=1798910 RepID=UPI0030DB0FA7|tara:strand:- start:239169 stop:242054 length:2886 start_codon:yes stop_codon:yes gene_type:complete